MRILRESCPNLLAEARLYRYAETTAGRATSENPLDNHNHALAALRYLVSRIDAGFMARYRQRPKSAPLAGSQETNAGGCLASDVSPPWLRLDNEQLWQGSA